MKGWTGLRWADWTDHQGSCEYGRTWPANGPCDSNSARTHGISVTRNKVITNLEFLVCKYYETAQNFAKIVKNSFYFIQNGGMS